MTIANHQEFVHMIIVQIKTLQMSSLAMRVHCTVTFHQKCYSLGKTLCDKIIDSPNLMFLCDDCVNIMHPTNMVNMCNNMYAMAKGMEAMKNVVDTVESELKSQTAQMPPASLFLDMVTSIKEVHESLKKINEVQKTAATKNDEALEAIQNVQSTVATNLTPPVDWNALNKLMVDVCSELQNNNKGSNGPSVNPPS